NPHIQDILCKEVNSVMDSNGEIIYEELAKLPYLDSVISETLRLHSPAQRISRLATTDYPLGETGITLKAGQQIDFPIYAIHTSEEYYPKPFQFNPDRFMPENRHNIIPYTYLPFGAGPRNCIGMRFALLEAKLALAHIVTKYKFLQTPNTDVPIKYKRSLGLTAPQRLIVGIEKRLYLTRDYNYWSKRGINGPKPLPIFGSLLDFFIIPQPLQEINWFKKYGKIYGYYFLKNPVLTIADPELIKTILVKDFHVFTDRRFQQLKSRHPVMSKNMVDATGDDWKRIRSIASPTFTSGKMKSMYPRIRECLSDFMNHLETFADNKTELNAKDMYGNYTMDVIATCAFATKTDVHKNLDSLFVLNARRVFNFNLFKLLSMIILPAFVVKKLNLSGAGTNTGTEFFLNSTKQIISTRKQTKKKYNDFIQLLMDVEKGSDDERRDETDVHESHHVNEGKDELESEKKAFNIQLTDKHLTENEILAQALIFFLAGYETTATTLTFCTYELALNPHIQQRLYKEIVASVDSDGEISYEELAKLPFLDSVLSETLRLHSPAQRLARLASTDYKLGDTGITLYKGQMIEIPIYGIHHSEEYYPNPFQFNPDRFMPENRHNIIPYTYLPFGAGPRNCIGMRFALLEAKLALVHIIKKFRERSYIELDWIRKYGKIYGVFEGNTPILSVADPELIRKILVKDFHVFNSKKTNTLLESRAHPILVNNLIATNGDQWKRLRSVMTPAFSSAKMRKMYSMIKTCLNELLDSLDVYAIDNNEVDMKTMYGNLTMDVISSCAFGTQTNSHTDPNSVFVTNANKSLNPKPYRLLLSIMLPKVVMKLFNMKHAIEESANEFFFTIVRQIMNGRKNSKNKFNDFLDLLINLEKNDNNEDHNESHMNAGEEEKTIPKKTLSDVNHYITEDEILANAWIFFQAGYETTATTLTFATYELALNQHIQQKLYEEIQTSVDSKGDIDYDLLTKLPYLDAVISETLRLHAPSVRVARTASEDYRLGDTGIIIKKGQSVEVPIYAMAHLDEFFPNPESFIPDRFLPENKHNIVPYTYLPFGGGPRNCVGMRFGLMEAKLALAHVVLRYRFIESIRTDRPIQLLRNLFLHTPKRVVVGIQKR
ncbi:unnamed protein product, partial [Medioppia subpectinata]